MKHVNKFLPKLLLFQHKTSLPANERRVTESELQQLYNDSDIEIQLTLGKLREVKTASSHVRPDALPRNCVWCADSIEHTLYDVQSNDEVARLHCFLNKDGTIGASGKWDPKFLVLAGIEYHIHRKPPKGPLTGKRHPVWRFLRKWLWRWPRHKLVRK